MRKHRISFQKIKSKIPSKKRTANKSHGGRTLIIAGSTGMMGASVLAAHAAARVGSGYTTVMTDLKNWSSVDHPDFLTQPFSLKQLKQSSFHAVALGPGLGKNRMVARFIDFLKTNNTPAVVIDADAWNVVVKNKIYPLLPSWICTPHTGELARLLNVSVEKIDKNREWAITTAQSLLGCHVILKGYRTLVCDGNCLYEIQNGNKALAKAGTGDVLTGMITGFLAQGVSPLDACLLATSLHGALADEWIKKKSYHSLLASDLIKSLGQDLPGLLQKTKRASAHAISK